jgi:ABC-type Fe3+/spermidine/putrescine transport system ATPase subunit
MGEHSLEDLGMTPREREEFELRARVERAVTDAVISRRVDAVMNIVTPITERAERAEAAFDRYQQAKQPLARSFAMACKEIVDLRQQLKLAEHVNTHSGE